MESTLLCAVHPQRETTLRCNRCEKPICAQCAVLTPVGYRCKECVRGQQAKFDTVKSVDYPVVFIATAIGVGVGISLLSLLGIFGIFLAPVIGGGLAEILPRLMGHRRSRRLPYVAVAGGVFGILFQIGPVMLTLFLFMLSGQDLGILAALGATMIWPAIYGALILSTFYYRFGSIRM